MENEYYFEVNSYFFKENLVKILLDLVEIKYRKLRIKLKDGSEINGKYITHYYQTKLVPYHVDIPTTIFIKTINGEESFNSHDFESFEVDKNQY